MPGNSKSDIKLGFYIALGFFLFGLILAVAQYAMLKLRNKA
jgi:hypothetical protein